MFINLCIKPSSLLLSFRGLGFRGLGGCYLCFGSWKSNRRNGLTWAHVHTLSAQSALGIINIGHIIFDNDGAEGALFRTFATAYASRVADLHSGWSAVLVTASHIHAAVFHASGSQLNDMSWARLHTAATGRAQ